MLSENAIIAIKTITYRFGASLMTFISAFVMTESVAASSMITIGRGMLGMLWYAIHEKLWEIIKRTRLK